MHSYTIYVIKKRHKEETEKPNKFQLEPSTSAGNPIFGIDIGVEDTSVVISTDRLRLLKKSDLISSSVIQNPLEQHYVENFFGLWLGLIICQHSLVHF